MYVTKMLGPEDGNDEVTDNPTWKDIERALRSLDGKENTAIILFTDRDFPRMSVAGGTNSNYIAWIAYNDDEVCHSLIDPAKQNAEDIFIVCGGQGSLYLAEGVIDLDILVLAAKTFSESGELDNNVSWSQDRKFL